MTHSTRSEQEETPGGRQTYASAGVDIARADRFVERLKRAARRPDHARLWSGAGGYAAVYPLTDDKAIALTTDGVGTKLLVAVSLNRYDTIGVDLVAMCANDLICVGARPTLFLDYLATGKLHDEAADALISGILAGCDQAGMLLVGGETAEMPGVYQDGHFDLAGFAVGEVTRSKLISGDAIRPGQKVIGVASSGIHSNGLSLARKLIPESSPLWPELLTPTSIYVRPLLAAFDRLPGVITGLAHITGGGWSNLLRLNEGVGYAIDKPLPVPAIFEELSRHVPEGEMYGTFNMGMGMAIITGAEPELLVEIVNAAGFAAQVVGEVTSEAKTLTVTGTSVCLKG